MVVTSSLQLSNRFLIGSNYGYAKQKKCVTRKEQPPLISSNELVRDAWSLYVQSRIRERRGPSSSKFNIFTCRAFFLPNGGNGSPVMKKAALILSRTFSSGLGNTILLKLGPALAVIVFAAWGLRPLIRMIRNSFLHKNDSSWNKSSTHYITTSYVQPLLIWIGTMLICRALEPVILPTEASDAVKKRLLNFVRSLSTVMAFGYCTSSLIQQMQKFLMETSDSNDARNMGFDFASKAVYTAVWVAAVSLFMELLGFSTQKWLTAGGLGTVLLTLAGREIFTNFLSSVMIHTTRPFVLNEWIQTKIEGYEVSGTVEHVGWWSPTIIRGDDREAVHIPNHKFTVSVVRNLSQKSHWRIKTHFTISHLDVDKIGNIVADMRKVLSKNPQVEQQRLHRRVFLDNVDQESQALRILVSCFVKTSHFEEYLCVKEAVILDLLRVIRHHGARLATPIRTIQRVYTGADADTTRAQDLANRPFLLIDSSYRVTSQNKSKTASRAASSNEEKDDSEPLSPSNKGFEEDFALPRPSSPSSNSTPSTPKQEGEKTDIPSPSTPVRPVLEDNIVLGVALEGSKRTLPIEEMSPPENDMESMELVGKPNGSGAGSAGIVKEKKSSEQTVSPGVNQGDNPEKDK